MKRIPISAVAKILEHASQEGWTDIIPMAGGEPKFASPTEALTCLQQLPPNSLTKYSPFKGYPRLLELIKLKLNSYNNIDMSERDVICVPGGSMAIFSILFVLLKHGDEVLIQDPCWEHYPEVIKMIGGVPKPFKMIKDDAHYRPDFENLKTLITNRTKIMLVNTPLNPCGSILQKSEIELLLQIAESKGIHVVCDEEYEAFTYGNNKHISPACMCQNAVSLHSFSKSFALTGIRLGYVSGNIDIIDSLKRFALYSYMFPPSPSQCMAQASLEGNYKDFLNHICHDYEKKMLRLTSRLNEIQGVECDPPEGGVYVFPKIALKSAAEVLINRYHVLCVPGSVSGEQGNQRIRLFFGLPNDQLDEAALRIEMMMKKYGN